MSTTTRVIQLTAPELTRPREMTSTIATMIVAGWPKPENTWPDGHDAENGGDDQRGEGDEIVAEAAPDHQREDGDEKGEKDDVVGGHAALCECSGSDRMGTTETAARRCPAVRTPARRGAKTASAFRMIEKRAGVSISVSTLCET